MTGMDVERDVPIETSDGTVLRADVFRPAGEGTWPVLLSYGPVDRPPALRHGRGTVHTGGRHASHLLLPLR